MATQTYYFTGKCQWAKVYKGQEDQRYQNFGLDVELDEKNLAIYKESGIQTHLQVSGEKSQTGREITWCDGRKGVTFVKFKRPVSKLIKGQLVNYGPPSVLDKDNQPFDKPIGNGSSVTCKVVVYDTAKGKGSRLETVRVDEWVEYKKDDAPAQVNVPKLPF